MSELLRIKNLGPLKEVEIEPRPLTVIIGPQASGKSLIAQCLYFFRGLEAHLAKRFSNEWLGEKDWQKAQIKSLLDDLRKVAFGYFANGKASLSYSNDVEWIIKVYEATRGINLSSELASHLKSLADNWSTGGANISNSINTNHIFIPTERSMFTRYADRAPSVIFNQEIQPYPFFEFADFLSRAKLQYPEIYERWLQQSNKSVWNEHFKFILDCQLRALAGAAYLPTKGPKLWKWSIVSAGNETAGFDRDRKIIPIEACASGQTEAWPFFVVAATYGTSIHRRALPPRSARNAEGAPPTNIRKSYFYIEEPETHLHPAAQVEVIQTIGYLVYLGHHIVITTHSPFILYTINNMIMRHLASGDKFRNGLVSLAPNDVTAYRVGDGKYKRIIDHEGTQLIEESELEDVANTLGAEFDKLFDKVDL